MDNAVIQESQRKNTMHFTNQIRIQCPVEEVFSFIADFRNIPRWNDYVKTVAKSSSGPIGPGTVFHQVRKTDQQRFQIVQYEANQLITVQSLPGYSPQFTRRLRFTPQGGTTVLNDTWHLDLGYPALLDWLVEMRAKPAIAKNLRILKACLEASQVAPQDARDVPGLADQAPPASVRTDRVSQD